MAIDGEGEGRVRRRHHDDDKENRPGGAVVIYPHLGVIQRDDGSMKFPELSASELVRLFPSQRILEAAARLAPKSGRNATSKSSPTPPHLENNAASSTKKSMPKLTPATTAVSSRASPTATCSVSVQGHPSGGQNNQSPPQQNSVMMIKAVKTVQMAGGHKAAKVINVVPSSASASETAASSGGGNSGASGGNTGTSGGNTKSSMLKPMTCSSAFKREVMLKSLRVGNRPAGRQYGVSESTIRGWFRRYPYLTADDWQEQDRVNEQREKKSGDVTGSTEVLINKIDYGNMDYLKLDAEEDAGQHGRGSQERETQQQQPVQHPQEPIQQQQQHPVHLLPQQHVETTEAKADAATNDPDMEIMLEVLNHTKLHSIKETSVKFGIPESTILSWYARFSGSVFQSGGPVHADLSQQLAHVIDSLTDGGGGATTRSRTAGIDQLLAAAETAQLLGDGAQELQNVDLNLIKDEPSDVYNDLYGQ